MAGEFGGGRWAIERSSGAIDRVDYTDFRVFLGVEHKVLGGLDSRMEVGYAFARKLRYDSPAADVRPDGTLMVRAGVTY